MQEWLRRNWKLASLFALAFTWCSALVLARVVWTWNRDYLFLGFNLGLAGLPMLFSVLASRSRARVLQFGFGCLWLLFFPNAPYIVTDLIHLKALGGAPIWYDILMISSCAGTGLAFGYFSLVEMQNAVSRDNRFALGWTLAVLVCFAAAFGIYLGRFLRWHSVHAFVSPLSLISDIVDRFIHPFAHPRTWGFTLGFGMLLLLGYLILKIGADFARSGALEQQNGHGELRPLGLRS